MNWRLRRYRLGETVTDGRLEFPDDGAVLYTLERPWLPGQPGGEPFKSCIPDGTYELREHRRSDGDRVLALINPERHVYYLKADRPNNRGRYLCLIHPANYVKQVEGCVAPGVARTTAPPNDRPMVTNSRAAMQRIMELWDSASPKPKLEIFTEALAG